jgi:uncharacterized delta-60 repeat protein
LKGITIHIEPNHFTTMKNLLRIAVGILLVCRPGLAQTTLDASFNANQLSVTPNFTTVRTIVVQPDGKILFGGTSDYDNAPKNDGPSFGRLNADGSWDTPFQNNVGYTPNTGFYFREGGVIERVMALDGGVTVRDLVLLPDGKIIVAGDFAMFNTASVVSLARLNANGTLDAFGERGGFTDYFVPGLPGFGVNAVARQSDGKLVVGGNFTATGDGSIVFGYIARVDANGGIDPQFTAAGNPADAGFNAGVDDLEMLPDGDVLVAGRFSAFRNVPCGPLARLNADYTLDVAFFAAQGTGFAGGQITRIAVQADGKIIVAGSFTAFNGVSIPGILRLNNDGSLDNSFLPGSGASGTILSLALQQDGKIIAGGNFTSFNGLPRSGIVRLNTDGSVDTTFDPGTGFAGRPNDGVMGVYALALRANGQIMGGGDIGSYNGTNRNSIVRLTDTSLPVHLVAFNVKTEGAHAFLNWSTSFETNSESFAIERSSDGKKWITIGIVNAFGESKEIKQYAFTDLAPLNGSNLYRLKMIDRTADRADQTFAYSRIQSAVFNLENAVIVYPNPAQDLLYLQNVSISEFKKLTIYNAAGRQIKALSFGQTDQKGFSGIDIGQLTSGVYIVRLTRADGTSSSQRIVIKR